MVRDFTPSAVAEEATRLLANIHYDHQRLPDPPVRGRIFRSRDGGRLGVQDALQARRQSTFLRSVSIVEAYIDTHSSDMMTARIRGLGEFYELLADAAIAAGDQNWEGRRVLIQRYFDVALGDIVSWSSFKPCIQVRNSIAHGLGGLTRQQRTKKDRQTISQARVQLSGDRIILDGQSLAYCKSVCTELILALDRQLQR